MLVELQVLPDPTGTRQAPYQNINAAIARLRAGHVRCEVGALGTTFEGAPDEIWPLIRAAHEATLDSGAGQVITIIKVAQSATDDSAFTIDRLTSAHRRDAS